MIFVKAENDGERDVTVIIVNWNSGPLLKECLSHLKRQTVTPKLVIVVDNASSDGSGEVTDPIENLKVIKMADNIGFAAGNNHGLAECDTSYVALLNPDAFPQKDWIEQMLKAADRYPDVAAFGSRQLRYGDTQVVDGTGDCYHLSGIVWRKGYGMRQQSLDLLSCEIFSTCAAAAFYRRQALMEVGGFDADYFCYVEDVDLGFRLRLAGHKAMYVPEAVVHHVGSASSGGRRSDFCVYHAHRNIVWTFVKNMPGVLFWILLPLHVLSNLLAIIVFTARGQHFAIMKSKKEAIQFLPQTLLKRRAIQNVRVATIQNIWHALDRQVFPVRKW